MGTIGRRLAVTAAAAIGAVLGLVGLAWACTASPGIKVTGPPTWPATAPNTVEGSTSATLSGWGFPSGEVATSPVEFRVTEAVSGSKVAAEEGTVIASGVPDQAGLISVPVVVPDIAPGAYLLSATHEGRQLSVVTLNVMDSNQAAPSLSGAPGSALRVSEPVAAIPGSDGGSKAPVGLLVMFSAAAVAGGAALVRRSQLVRARR